MRNHTSAYPDNASAYFDREVRPYAAYFYRIQSCDQPPSTGSSAPVVKVASNARNRTALAISSDVPQRFIGFIAIIFSLIWAASSLPVNTLPTIGVSMGPGVTALTRIS